MRLSLWFSQFIGVSGRVSFSLDKQNDWIPAKRLYKVI